MLENVGTCWNRQITEHWASVRVEKRPKGPTMSQRSIGSRGGKDPKNARDGKERTCYRNSMLPSGHDLKWGCEGIDQSLVEATMAVSNYLN